MCVLRKASKLQPKGEALAGPALPSAPLALTPLPLPPGPEKIKKLDGKGRGRRCAISRTMLCTLAGNSPVRGVH